MPIIYRASPLQRYSASLLLEEYGSYEAMRESSSYVNGVYVLTKTGPNKIDRARLITEWACKNWHRLRWYEKDRYRSAYRAWKRKGKPALKTRIVQMIRGSLPF